MTQQRLTINAQFDGGAITVLAADQPQAIRLALRPDQGVEGPAEFKQWFYFRVWQPACAPLHITLENAAEAAYPSGWPGYQAVASHDRVHWFRVPTRYVDGQLVIDYMPAQATTYFAYFEPYSWERHMQLLGWAQAQPQVQLHDLGLSVQGRPISLLQIGEANPSKKKVWVIARQHPGETMAEWFVEGLLQRLLDVESATSTALAQCVWYVVPNMNPDGAYLGNLRTNAAGANLNREWLAPSLQRSPEVLCVREAIAQTGVDLFLDVHGDEGLPYVFIEGGDSLPSFSEAQRAAQARFFETFLNASPDFQTEQGYPTGADTKTNLSLASKYVGHTHGCLAMTLEMPFKDNANRPDPLVGWNGARSQALGAAVIEPILAALDLPTTN
ncbi:M14 family metallopeptidase [Parvibium lacunae]|uniref:Peptidase M14 domain-containing protein n=1 Tax=Parvibium lacunae TaxID=1888893 RepID=A0A368L6M0_9BURK|nr:M14-type cytosolic carboxypeptidase [Parvibium lacunae]RCS59320.1 hypothetical protein DU000_00830 [Parvibium lacunae]